MFQRRRHGKVDFNRYLSRESSSHTIYSKFTVLQAKPASDYNVGVDVAYTALSCEVKYLPTCHCRDWVDYRDGFGDFKLWNDEFWLGNEHMYSLLSEGQK